MGKVIESHHDLETIKILCIDQLVRGVQMRNHPFREVAMATSKEAPNIRMVVLRKVDQIPFSIFVYTDARSEKITELKEKPQASFLFWHPSSKLQLKLKTSISIHHKDKIANEHYKLIGVKGRESYNTESAPGSVLEVDKNPPMPLRQTFTNDDFCVLKCQVEEMEVLQLRKEGHVRARFSIETGVSNFLVP